jgi:transposase
MDPFHVVRLAGDALDQCHRRVQQATCGHHGNTGDPLDAARRTLHTGSDLLTALFADDEHVEVEATWGIYQHMIAAYREPDRKRGRERTLKRRAVDVLADFDRPGTSNGPTEAINGRLEHLRGSALGFRNLTNYIARSPPETGGFRPRLHPGS